MSCEDLLCAGCGGPVAEGRCPTCRAARRLVHSHGPSPAALVTLLVATLLAALAVLLVGLGGLSEQFGY